MGSAKEATSIYSLPDEVLAQVFTECLPVSRVPTMTTDEAPLLLTHICSPFRTLTHSLPELWVSAHLLLAWFRPGTMDDATEETESEIQAVEDKARLPFIKEWFKRTGTRSLHLTISDEMIFANIDSCITDYALTLLDRVESLDLLVCRRTLPRFTESIPNAYTRLKRLRTVGDAFEPEDWAFLRHDAPHLVEFETRSLQYPAPSLPLQFDRITRLAVSYFPNLSHCPSTTDMIALLRSAPQLQSLRMVVHSEDPPTETPILFHNIRALQLYMHGSVVELFTFVRMPNLRDVHFTEEKSIFAIPQISGVASLNAFARVQKRHAALVQRLKIEPSRVRFSQVQTCLKHFTGLRHLVFLSSQWYRGPNSIPAILASLTPWAPNPPELGCICRSLDTLEIHTTCLTPFEQFEECLHGLRLLLRTKASASQHDPEKFSRIRVVTLPSQWRPEEGTPLAADLALCVEETKVQLTFLGEEDERSSTGYLKRGFWEEKWWDA